MLLRETTARVDSLSAELAIKDQAAHTSEQQVEGDKQHITRLSDKFLKAMKEEVTEIELNGCPENRYFGNLNISFACVEGESLIMALTDIAVSSGSACTSASLEPSYVLRAIGVTEDMAHTSLRIGIGRFTSEAEVDYAIALIGE